jgi:hypothetical protein
MIYQIEMSRGPSIKIDEEDLAKIKANIGESLISVKQGIINPSFMISIIPTDDEDTKIEKKVEIVNGRPMMIVGKKTSALSNKMNINNKQIKA